MNHKKINNKRSISKLGDKNPNWKGDEQEVHNWVKRRKIKPEFCECCGVVSPYDLANISQEYKRDINDFEWLCRRCHMKKDGRIYNNLHSRSSKLGEKNGSWKGGKEEYICPFCNEIFYEWKLQKQVTCGKKECWSKQLSKKKKERDKRDKKNE